MNPTDAVNVSQLQNSQQQFSNQLNDVKRIAYSGAALAMAMSGNYMPNLEQGESAMGVGFGNYKGYSAVGLAYKSLDETGKVAWGAGLSTTGRQWGISAGVGWKWK